MQMNSNLMYERETKNETSEGNTNKTANHNTIRQTNTNYMNSEQNNT